MNRWLVRLVQAACPHWNRFREDRRGHMKVWSTTCPVCQRRLFILGDGWVSEEAFEAWYASVTVP